MPAATGVWVVKMPLADRRGLILDTGQDKSRIRSSIMKDVCPSLTEHRGLIPSRRSIAPADSQFTISPFDDPGPRRRPRRQPGLRDCSRPLPCP